MTFYYLLFIGTIALQTSVSVAADFFNGMFVGTWILAQDPVTKYTNPEPIPRSTITDTIAPCASPDSPSENILSPELSYNLRKRKAELPERYKNIPPTTKRRRYTKKRSSISPTIPATCDKVTPASPTSPLISDSDAPATPPSPQSPIKPGREQVMLEEENKFTPDNYEYTPADIIIIGEAITKVLLEQEHKNIEQALTHTIAQGLAKQRVKKPTYTSKMNKLARDVKKLFAQLDKSENLHSLAADIQIFEKYNGDL